MAYQSWSVVYGEQPSAAKWNILGTNDASFNDGTGIADKNYQTDNSNSISSTTDASLLVQTGWNQISGSGAISTNATVTFPEAFGTVLSVTASMLGATGNDSVPASAITDIEFETTTAFVSVNDITNSQFQGTIALYTGILSSSRYWCFSWIAIGTRA